MKILPLLRRSALALAIVAIVAGCATPQESGPTDLNADKDRNGLPDDAERDLANSTDGGNESALEPMPGAIGNAL